LQKIRVGLPCEIQLDAFPDLRFRGKVSRLVPTIDRAKATVLTKVSFLDRDEDARILPEMSAKIAFLSREVTEDQRKPRTVAPADAIAMRDGRSVVFVVADGRAKQVPVQTGDRLGDALVVAGVAAGDRIVAQPEAKLRDGSAVRLAQK
jgi:multidrug efflux pump subunit AcrA (membrane-fusion protein)